MAGLPGCSGEAGHPAGILVSYIIRRLIAAVGLVIVISMITFAIFYLIPRLGGRHAGDDGGPLRRASRPTRAS